MRPNRVVSAFFSLPVMATSLLTACLFTTRAGRAQSAQQAEPARQPTAAEISKKETVASAFLRGLQYQEYEVRSAAEAMPEEKYGYRPPEGKFKYEKPEFGPAEVRTFAQQVKHVACSNFGFAAELDGQTPPAGCDKDGPSPAKTKKGLLIYLRDSFAAIRKSLGAMDAKNMFDPIEGPYAGPNTRLGIAPVIVWHNADHYGQMALPARKQHRASRQPGRFAEASRHLLTETNFA
jgi:DinB family protein